MSEVEMIRTRRSIGSQLQEALDARGVTWTVGCESERDGLRYVVDGVTYSPGEAADKFLPGGFAGSFGRA